MTKKYFFFDIDGTLGLGISSIIPADSLYCLRRLMKPATLYPSLQAGCSTMPSLLPIVTGFRPS